MRSGGYFSLRFAYNRGRGERGSLREERRMDSDPNQSVGTQDVGKVSLAGEAVQLAAALLEQANRQQTEGERSQAQKIARMIDDPAGKELTIALVDQAFRSRRPARIAD